MSSRLSDRLNSARRERFTGRAEELALFERALGAVELPFCMLYIHGPGGVGKTTLLAQFADLAEHAGARAVMVDGRNLEATPESFLAAMRLALGVDPATAPAEVLAGYTGRSVLLIDTFDMLAPLEGWLRDVFLPDLSDRVLVVLASRHPPASPWRADPGWQQVLKTVALRNLSPDEGRAYLTRRQVPAPDLPAILSFTHSYPLALSLVADLYEQRQDYHFAPAEAHDVVAALLERFLQRVPGPAHRAALEVCALARVTTESFLAEILAVPDAHDLFEWLRGLSFVQSRPGGLFPHDVAREVLVADLRWRNPQWYAELHRRARVHYARRLHETQGVEQQLVLFDFVYLHRENPAVRPFFEWQASGRALPDRFRPEDAERLAAMVARYEGPESARLASYWLARQPENVVVFRDLEGQPAGFMTLLALERATSEDLAVDAAIGRAWEHLSRHAPLRAGESATYFRFWLAAETYQAVSPTQSLIFITMVRHYFTPGLAYTFYACADADFWLPVFSYAELERRPELDFEVGAARFGVYVHDWRAMPPLPWLELLGQRELAAAPEMIRPPVVERLVVLSQEEFVEAVEAALRNYARPDALRGSPLLRSRVVTGRVGAEAAEGARIAALRDLLKAAAEQLRQSPKENKFYRAVHHTWFQPAATQEQAAELLDVPLSSYRRHLRSGAARIAEILWYGEVGGVE
ncbi:MAG: ATP-binding protein [Chloroflexaceae bacterium]